MSVQVSEICARARTRATEQIGLFLSDYASTLLASGATCLRLEKNVGRMAEVWGVRVAMTIMPHHIHFSVTDHQGLTDTFVAQTQHSAASFDAITRLSALSWKVADNRLTLSQARSRFAEAMKARTANRWWVLFAASCANASFCRLFGGDFHAMAVVFGATAAGVYLKQLLVRARADIRLVFIVCSFVSAVLAAAGYIFSLGGTPEVAMATSVLYLVPGIPLLNSFSDMVDGHYICFFCRLLDALILTCCLSLGLCLAMKVMNISMF